MTISNKIDTLAPESLKDGGKVRLGNGGFAPASVKDSGKVRLGNGGFAPVGTGSTRL